MRRHARLIAACVITLLAPLPSARAAAPVPTEQIRAGRSPDEIAVDPVRHRAYVATRDRDITIIDLRTKQRVGAFDLVGPNYSGWGARGLAVDLSTGNLLVGTPFDPVALFTAEGQFLRVFDVPDYAYWLAIDHVVRRGFVSHWSGNRVSVIDLDSGAVIGTVAAGGGPISVDAVTHRVFVAENGRDSVAVIDATTLLIERRIATRRPFGVAVDETSGRVYVGGMDYPAPVTVFDGSTGAIVASTSLGTNWCCVQQIAVDPIAARVYVGKGGSVIILDAATLLRIGDSRFCWPGRLAVDPGLGQALSTNSGNFSIAVIGEGDASVTDLSAPETELVPVGSDEQVARDGRRWSRWGYYVHQDCFDALSGCGSGSISTLDGQPVSSSYAISVYTDGIHRVARRSQDCAGNMEAQAVEVTVNIDRSAPVAQMENAAGDIIVPGAPLATLVASATDVLLDGTTPGAGVVGLCFRMVRQPDEVERGTRDIGCYPAAPDAAGRWRSSPQVPSGVYAVSAVPTDLVGNVGLGSPSVTVRIISVGVFPTA